MVFSNIFFECACLHISMYQHLYAVIEMDENLLSRYVYVYIFFSFFKHSMNMNITLFIYMSGSMLFSRATTI